VPVDVTFRQDTLAIRKWTLRAPWVADEKYRLTIPAGAFENTSGQSNDTLRSEFTIESPDKFATLVLKLKRDKDYKVDVSELGPNERLYDRIPVCQPNAAGTGYDNVELVGNLANNLPVMVAVGCHTNKNGEKYMRPDMVVLPEGVRYWGSGNNGHIDLSAWGINLTNTVVAAQPAAAPAQPQPQPMF